MPENLHLVTELAIILIAAGVFTIISKALNQPLILGYIIAGFLVGPHLGLFPQFSVEAINEWSEIGVIFLLFSLGLEFSFKKLLKIGSSALITTGVKCLGMFGVGIFTAMMMGWTTMEAIFFGGLLGMSSTTIIIKAYDDMGLKQKPYATLIFGSLVFEDLIAVLLMVLLSTLVATGKFEGVGMLAALGKLVFFLVLWFLIGIYVIPLLMKKVKRYLSDEILLLVGIGMCFLMVVIANLVGFSSALGAFVMGSILAETVEGERVEKLTSQIKDLFGAIFFISVGMMVDPVIIGQYWMVIIIITLVAMAGIVIFSTTGALLAGNDLDTSVHAGFSLAQLGEFAFIISGLGCSLGVLRDFINPVIIAVSVITTFTTPYMIKAAGPVSKWLYKVLPVKLLSKLNASSKETKKSEAEKSEWKKLLKKYFLRIFLYSVAVIAVIKICHALHPKLSSLLPEASDTLLSWLGMIVCLILMAPFLYGMVMNGTAINESSNLLLKKNPHNRWTLLALMTIRAAIATFFVVGAIMSYFQLANWVYVLLSVLSVVAFVLITKYSVHQVNPLEVTFMNNFNEKEAVERKTNPVSTKVAEILHDYDVHIQTVRVSPDFEYIGKSLREMPFRRTAGANVIKIQRGSHSILIPHGDEIIYPDDLLVAVGSTAQLKKFEQVIADNTVALDKNDQNNNFAVSRITLDADSSFTGKTLRELGMRASGCMVVSVLRGDKLIANPVADFCFEEGDILWLAGDEAAVKWFEK